MNKQTFTIIGMGFVGGAVYNAMKDAYRLNVIDPHKGEEDDPSKYEDVDGFIICVPTPEGKYGYCDDHLVTDYIERIRLQSRKPILIKSTTDIETLSNIAEEDVTFSPEFLVAANANEDFKNQDFAIFGGANGRFWYNVFNSVCNIGAVRFTDIVTAGFVKYTINSFLATKVVFFNELQILFGNSSDVSFDQLTELVSLDKRIGSSHMQVPGPDGKYGFGGACFPKDTKAFTKFAESSTQLELLKKAIDINDSKLRY